MAEPAALKYRAFISYSHADTSWAKWLHGALESFPIDDDLAGRETVMGVIPRTFRPIFRDRDEFAAGHTLTDQTLAALDQSRALIAVCSPASARSRYVNEEIRLFKSRHPQRPVIPLIVAGKPGNCELECFPPCLRLKLDSAGQVTDQPIEVLAADVREEGDGRTLALAKVIAGLIGVSPDDIFRRAERERIAALRRRRRIQALIGALAVALLAAGMGWLKQDFLRDNYYWTSAMGPNLLTTAQERQLKPKDEFKECMKGCPTMVVVPPGSFLMGSPKRDGPPRAITEEWELPQHPVEIAKAFAVSKFEITYDQWEVCVAFGDCNPRVSDSGWGYGRQPVATASWDDAKRYVAWLSRMTGKPYRLLSEAEWEYAARAGTRTDYWWGNEVGKGNANCQGCNEEESKSSAPVGSFPPNGFGLYDMNGNVSEWVEDTLQYDYEGAPSDGSPWIKTAKLLSRVVRGGHWGDDPIDIRSASRNSQQPERFNIGSGFRVARTITTDPPEASSEKGVRPARTVEPESSLNLAGVYRLTATDSAGKKHSGMLTIAYTGTFFGIARWMKGSVVHGVGRLTGGKLVVEWGGTGPATYVLESEGRLAGEWADGAKAETAEPTALAAARPVRALEGQYKVEGHNPNGTPYTGNAVISKRENGYYVRWEVGNSDYAGEGVLKHNILTVNWGGSTPAVYAIAGGGRLIGLWSSGEGEETLTPVH